MSKAVFLDRDGTINFDTHYLYKKEDLKFLPGVIDALKKFKFLKFKLIIITNQSGINRGIFSEDDFNEFMVFFLLELSTHGVLIDGVYFCQHTNEEKCTCRKPEIGLVKKAVNEFKIDTSKSFFIGDKTSDILTGKRCGCKTILVKTGNAGSDNLYDVQPDFIVPDLLAASTIVETELQ